MGGKFKKSVLLDMSVFTTSEVQDAIIAATSIGDRSIVMALLTELAVRTPSCKPELARMVFS